MTGLVRRAPRLCLLAGLLVVWLIGYAVFRGDGTRSLAPAELTDLHRSLDDLNDWVGSHRDSNPVLVALDQVRSAVSSLTDGLLTLLAGASTGAGYPLVGWLGVVALASWATAVFGNLRATVVVLVCLFGCGLLGTFTSSMETLALTLAAVLVCVVLGLPLGVWAGVDHRVGRLVTPVLDLAQILPSFVYLAPLALIFLIGPAAGVITTVIYAMPPLVRLTMHGVSHVPEPIEEAAQSLGVSRGQRLRWVVLPLARRSIVLGLNQTTLAALAMATIVALLAAPGLGQDVITALQSQDVGRSATAGLAIVLLAVALDRATSAVGLRDTSRGRSRATLLAAGLGLVAALVCVQLSRTQLWAAVFPDRLTFGTPVADAVNSVTDTVTTTLSPVTLGVRDGFTDAILNPLQSLLTGSPAVLVTAVLCALAALATSRSHGPGRAALAAAGTAGAALLVVVLGVWGDSMVTLAATVVAGALTMLLALVVGVWLGRSPRADLLVRPVLDAAQTVPPFVYLIPFLGLFGPSRFTAIVAAIVYAAPIAIKIIAEGVRTVPEETLEATRSLGASRWQEISTTQLPLARSSVALAANQGLIYVLSMIVVGGLVGAGGLGYLVVAGFAQVSLFGKGLAAGLTIVVWGIVIDRITQTLAAEQSTTSRVVRRPSTSRADAVDAVRPARGATGAITVASSVQSVQSVQSEPTVPLDPSARLAKGSS